MHPVELAAVHSGAVCPGLIEAAFAILLSKKARAGIPGQSAPASLKPTSPKILLSRHLAHSGAVCPGLIEAATGA